YATLGELLAWIIGWDLIIEYAVSAAAVSPRASHFFPGVVNIFHISLPAVLTDAPFDYNRALGQLVSTGKYLDLPAMVIISLVTVVLVIGIRERDRKSV